MTTKARRNALIQDILFLILFGSGATYAVYDATHNLWFVAFGVAAILLNIFGMLRWKRTGWYGQNDSRYNNE